MKEVLFYELEGVALDWVVSKIQGVEVEINDGRLLTGETRFEANSADDSYGCEFDVEFNPSENPADIIAIIKQEKIGIDFHQDLWWAKDSKTNIRVNHPDLSVAVLRTFVGMNISKLNQNPASAWVLVPDELIETNHPNPTDYQRS
jgi:hypothetical protein